MVIVALLIFHLTFRSHVRTSLVSTKQFVQCFFFSLCSLLDAPSLPRARSPRQRPKRGLLSRAFYRVLGKAFAKSQVGPRQRKATVTAPFPWTVSLSRAVYGPSAENRSLPRVSTYGPRQINYADFFLKKSLPRAEEKALGKDPFFAEG